MKVLGTIFIPIVSFLVSVAGLVILTTFASLYKAPVYVISFALFGSALIIAYSFYIVFYLLRRTAYEEVMRKWNAVASYVLISATYTPIYLIVFPNNWGWSMFGITWGMTFVGAFLYFFKRVPSKVHACIFIIIDWLIVVSFYPLYSSLPFFAIKVLTLGSALYTMAIIMERLDHLRLAQINMLLGSLVHIWFMYTYILG